MKFFEKLDSLDVRWLYLLLAIVVTIPFFKPFGLPIQVDNMTRQAFDTIESAPPGSYVFLSFDFLPSTLTENGTQAAIVARHCFQRNLKVLVGSAESNNEGVQLAQSIIEPIAKEMNKEYGVDWVNLGFKVGGGLYVRSMIEDIIKANADQDFTGKKLSEMPIMQGIKSLKECEILASFTSLGGALNDFVAYLYSEYGNKVIAGITGGMITQYIVYLQSGQYKGILGGLTGAAQYEFLLGKPGKAIQGMDSQSAAHALFFVFVVLGNIGFYLKSKKRS
ncbi:MAG: hypothetical protein IMF26_09850 [Candidatus Fermentithermobacillus carboniphilus]|uniref:Uncharacterized protein n=1 Tax=Candidatus Fermentithermobacillus carboniphilus TaxID=3085328 RepID=A0AAT9LDU9_9FIRM|nr:MAG: hypothetical protein IMF26_09850 [Candidatus Fermentithermobacillus carboniphilus]